MDGTRTLRSFAWGCFLLAFMGCGTADPIAPTDAGPSSDIEAGIPQFHSCSDTSQCVSGSVCVNWGSGAAYCRPVCQTTADCGDYPYPNLTCQVLTLPSGRTLDRSVCNDGPVALPVEPDSLCTDSSQCRDGEFCANWGSGPAYCRAPCSTNAACSALAFPGTRCQALVLGDGGVTPWQVCGDGPAIVLVGRVPSASDGGVDASTPDGAGPDALVDPCGNAPGCAGCTLLAGCGWCGQTRQCVRLAWASACLGGWQTSADSCPSHACGTRICGSVPDPDASADAGADAGLSCGTCPAGSTCVSNGTACSVCPAQCASEGYAQNRDCGSDGCGGFCGACPAGQVCWGISTDSATLPGRCRWPNVPDPCLDHGAAGCRGCVSVPEETHAPSGDAGTDAVADAGPRPYVRPPEGCGWCGATRRCLSGSTATPYNELCPSDWTTSIAACTCTRSCAGRACGDDGCGGSCGTCPDSQRCDGAGHCLAAPDRCAGRLCGRGLDGDPAWCGTCTTEQRCDAARRCEPITDPCYAATTCGACAARAECGWCEGSHLCMSANAGRGAPSLGTCAVGWMSAASRCPSGTCADRLCGPRRGESGSCGTCPSGWTCTAQGTCVHPDTPSDTCADLACSQYSPALHSSCGWCPAGTLCQDAGAGSSPRRRCVSATDRCSAGTDCADCTRMSGCAWCDATRRCSRPDYCPGRSVDFWSPSRGNPLCGCVPRCLGRECGEDGCGGYCGPVSCPSGMTCGADGRCGCTPHHCNGTFCGTDACSGVTCGCPRPYETCVAGVCMGTCTPNCAGRVCGPDGCGGLCQNPNGAPAGTCTYGGQTCSAAGQCVCSYVDSTCPGRECGPDESGTRMCGTCATGMTCCGGHCLSCAAGQSCYGGRCQAPLACLPACVGRVCGPNGCYGSCGACRDDQHCDPTGRCADGLDPCSALSTGDCRTCTARAGCGWVQASHLCLSVSDDPALWQGIRTPAQCVDRTPDCAGRRCGSDGCGGSCGPCRDTEACNAAGQCECVPTCAGRDCGDDNCGGCCGASCRPDSTYGSCPSGLVCRSNHCVTPCTPSCSGRRCGSDGCGGSCGTCAAGQSCIGTGQCASACTRNCTGRTCGDDGCGGSCGTCAGSLTCNASGRCETSGGGSCTDRSSCLSVSRYLDDVDYCRTIGHGTRDVLPVMRNGCSSAVSCRVCGTFGSSARECEDLTFSAGQSISGWASVLTWCDADGVAWVCIAPGESAACLSRLPH